MVSPSNRLKLIDHLTQPLVNRQISAPKIMTARNEKEKQTIQFGINDVEEDSSSNE